MIFDQPTARRTDPWTSHEAARRASKGAKSNRMAALIALREHGPLTDFELAEITGVAQTSIGVRRGELVKAGLVEKVPGVRRPSPSGSPAQVWRAT